VAAKRRSIDFFRILLGFEAHVDGLVTMQGVDENGSGTLVAER